MEQNYAPVFKPILVNTMSRFSKVNTGDKKSVKKVINKWKEKRFFDVMVLEDAMVTAGIENDNGSRRMDGRDRPAVASANEVLDLLSSASGNGHHQGPPRGYGNSFQGPPAFQNQRGPPQHMYGRGMLPNTECHHGECRHGECRHGYASRFHATSEYPATRNAATDAASVRQRQ